MRIIGSLHLNDGVSLSVQASEIHYCTPRDDIGPWTEVEVGFPSIRPEPWNEWVKYCEDPETPTKTVYAYVPIELVQEFIDAHNAPTLPSRKPLQLKKPRG